MRSPIMSCKSCGNSVSNSGSACLIFTRRSAMTSSEECSCFGLSLTEMSPVFASVTAANPSCKPVRREVLCTSCSERMICSTWLITRLVSARELPGGMM